MTDTTITLLAAAAPTLTALVGILINNARLSDLNLRINDLHRLMDARFASIDARFEALQRDMDARFEAMEKLFTEKLLRVEQVMDARIKHLEEKR